MRKKSNGNFVAQQPRQGWAYFEESRTWRRTPSPWGAPGDHFPKEYGGWVAVAKPKAWSPPEGTSAGDSLLSAGGASLDAVEGGGGGKTKIGAGHKPQPYGYHGWYGATGGGFSPGPVYRGKVRNWPQSVPPHQGTKPTPHPQEQRPPAPLSKGGRVVVSTKNDVPGMQGPNPEALPTETREQVQATLDKAPGAHNVNMNSGYRSGEKGPHGEGQAADINRINGQKVSDAVDSNVPEEQREAMRERLREIRAAAEANPAVEAYIDPLGGFFRPKDPNSKDKGREANDKDIYDHRHHAHITIRKALQARQ